MKITADMVKSFHIPSGTCLEEQPCQHDCIITLTDGKSKTVQLNSLQIESLINGIANEKILIPDYTYDHFSAFRYQPGSPIKKKPADEILTEIFAENS